MNISPLSHTEDRFPNQVSTSISRNLCHSVVQHYTDEQAFHLWKSSKSSLVHEYLDERIRDIVHVRYHIRQIDEYVKSPGFELDGPQGIGTVLTKTAALPPRYQEKVLIGLWKRCEWLWHTHPESLSALFIGIWVRGFEARRELLTHLVLFALEKKTPQWERAFLAHLIDVLATLRDPDASSVWDLFKCYQSTRSQSNPLLELEFQDFTRLLQVIARSNKWISKGKSIALESVIARYCTQFQPDDWAVVFQVLRGASSDQCLGPLSKVAACLIRIDASQTKAVLSRLMGALARLEQPVLERVLENFARYCIERAYPAICLSECIAAWRKLTPHPWNELATRVLPKWGTRIAKIAHSNLLCAAELVTDPELKNEVQATLKRYAP